MARIQESPVRGRILLFSYAFPPMQVQMTAAVYKPMAALVRAGYEVDVVCADSFCAELPLDVSLLPFAEDAFSSITRLRPSQSLLSKARVSSRIFSRIPDLMTVLQESAFEHLMGLDLSKYDAVMTWSPFHSINAVMANVKQHRRGVRWVAQFSDPWAGNPLEINRLTKFWNRYNEPTAVKLADAIVHSSRYSLDLMLQNKSTALQRKASVIPHAYDDCLFPQRPRAQNDKILLRYVGVLYGRRSPESLFLALADLLHRRPDLRDSFSVEFVGMVPAEMLQTPAALSLPEGTILTCGNVSFVESLAKMYDADVLVLIEANVKNNLFLASKLSDYIGSGTPMVGLVPPGASEDAFKKLGCWHAQPDDVAGISQALEHAVDFVLGERDSTWCDESYRLSFSGSQVAQSFAEIITKL